MTAVRDIELQRNATYARTWAFVDPETGDPLDLTGCSFDLDVKYAAGDSEPIIATATLTVEDAPGGLLQVRLAGSQFSFVPGPMQRVVLAYDLLANQSGIVMPIARGSVILLPGASNNAA